MDDKSELDQRYREILSFQLRANRGTFALLQKHGLSATTEVRLDFSFVAPSEAEARSLEGLLARETDYQVSVEPDTDGTWVVEGSTQPTAITLEILDQWVDCMVTAGLQENCEFDGWGTQVR